MRFTRFCLTLALITAPFFAFNASAHLLQISGNVNAVLHIDPDDDPIIGQPATLSVNLFEQQKIFGLSDCDCTIQISNNSGKIFEKQASGEPNLVYTFTKRGNYQLEISGKAIKPDAFQNFDVKYQLDIERTSSATPPDSGHQHSSYHALWNIIAYLAAFPVVIILTYFGEKRIKKKKQLEQKHE